MPPPCVCWDCAGCASCWLRAGRAAAAPRSSDDDASDALACLRFRWRAGACCCCCCCCCSAGSMSRTWRRGGAAVCCWSGFWAGRARSSFRRCVRVGAGSTGTSTAACRRSFSPFNTPKPFARSSMAASLVPRGRRPRSGTGEGGSVDVARTPPAPRRPRACRPTGGGMSSIAPSDALCGGGREEWARQSLGGGVAGGLGGNRASCKTDRWMTAAQDSLPAVPALRRTAPRALVLTWAHPWSSYWERRAAGWIWRAEKASKAGLPPQTAAGRTCSFSSAVSRSERQGRVAAWFSAQCCLAQHAKQGMPSRVSALSASAVLPPITACALPRPSHRPSVSVRVPFALLTRKRKYGGPGDQPLPAAVLCQQQVRHKSFPAWRFPRRAPIARVLALAPACAGPCPAQPISSCF